ncbi:polysaccharide deacetylase family protein [Paenibacillus sp. NRS-1760]|uniref:polysaccharide deacetylase family protein n=1 Tax=Paenibacillus sp. NRS-1760 TaxID=3233902 RepID=UPI003D2A1A6E
MDQKKKAALAIVIAVAMMVGWLLTGCSNENKVNSVQLIVNGTKLEGQAPAMIQNDRLMVSAQYLEQAFDKQYDLFNMSSSNKSVYYSEQVAVLMYHDIAIKPQSDGIIAVERFKKQMQLVKQNGFQVITIEQYINFMQGKGHVPDNALLITFDDGYESFYKLAYPILKEYGYPAVNFVIVSTIDDRTKPGTPKLTWDQMREMQQAGMSFMSHTFDMHRYGAVNEHGNEAPVMSKLNYDKQKKKMETKAEYVERLKKDLLRAEDRLKSELGNKVSTLAFPYGAYSEAVLELTKAVGIPITFTTKEGINSKFHHNGFRINGARAGETEDELFRKLKGDHSAKLFIDEKEFPDIHFSEKSGTEVQMIALRDIANYYDWKIYWRSDTKQVEIQTKQS